MARIEKYTAQQGLNPGSAPNVNLHSYVGDALQSAGNAVGNLADAIAKRDQSKENFAAEDQYKTLQLQLGQQMADQAANMPEDGAGFHDAFLKNSFMPARDKFLAGLPPRLREKFGTTLADDGSDATAWSIKAATAEKDQLYKWYDGRIETTKEQLATGIAADPEGYDALLKQGYDQIEASGLPTPQKMAHRKQWEQMAQIANLNAVLEKNPEKVLKDLGADLSHLSPTTQFGALVKALRVQENAANDPNATSVKGAVGLMQVMPRTAVDISKDLGDGLISADMSDSQITSILSNPVLNQKYGEYYLKKQIRTYGPAGGPEAALVAYNAGPGVAKKWIESGFDDSVLPAETRKYYKQIMARLPGNPARGSDVKGDPNKVQLVFGDRPDMPTSPQNQVNQDLQNRVKTAFSGLGIERVKINSGFRSEADNKRVGGADKSQHVHGNAMDIDVSGYSTAERVKIIQSLSANGITGIGVGSNIIHADTGGRRAWGYATSAGGGAVPGWAKAAIDAHLQNSNTVPNGRAGATGRFATLPYDKRQQFIHAADQAVTKTYNEQNKATAVQRVQLNNSIQNELATLTATGQSTGAVDDTAVSTILGEDDYVKYVRSRDTALRTFNATDGIENMTTEQMADRLMDYKPDPGSITFADDQKVAAAVQKKIDVTTRERANEPDKAALRDPVINELWKKIETDNAPTATDVQAFVKMMLDKQQEFNLKPGSEAPVPKAWAMEIGQSLSRIPELGAGAKAADVNNAILVQYNALEKAFGPYTDEVILYALSQYRGVGKNTGEVITGYMKAIQAGGDPMGRLQKRLDMAQDRDNVESASDVGWWQATKNFFSGEANDAAPDPAGEPEAAINPEVMNRAITALNTYGGDISPEEEAGLVARYGKGVVDAAKLRLGNN